MTEGERVYTGMTAVPMRTRRVTSAATALTTKASGPAPGAAIHRRSYPSASARSATRRHMPRSGGSGRLAASRGGAEGMRCSPARASHGAPPAIKPLGLGDDLDAEIVLVLLALVSDRSGSACRDPARAPEAGVGVDEVELQRPGTIGEGRGDVRKGRSPQNQPPVAAGGGALGGRQCTPPVHVHEADLRVCLADTSLCSGAHRVIDLANLVHDVPQLTGGTLALDLPPERGELGMALRAQHAAQGR